VLKYISVLLLLLLPNLAVAGEARNVNFAAFQKVDKGLNTKLWLKGNLVILLLR